MCYATNWNSISISLYIYVIHDLRKYMKYMWREEDKQNKRHENETSLYDHTHALYLER